MAIINREFTNVYGEDLRRADIISSDIGMDVCKIVDEPWSNGLNNMSATILNAFGENEIRNFEKYRLYQIRRQV